MTTSVWSSQEINQEFPECRTLEEIIRRIEAKFSEKGEVICEIRVNGMVLSEDDESRFAASPADEIRDLSIRSNRPDQLICDALDSARTFIPELETACLRAAESMRSADLQTGQKLFTEALDGCQWVIDTIIHVRGAASGIGLPIAQPERWFEAEKVIARVITEVSDAYTKSDHVLVADLLEYELTAALSIWREALDTERSRRG